MIIQTDLIDEWEIDTQKKSMRKIDPGRYGNSEAGRNLGSFQEIEKDLYD